MGKRDGMSNDPKLAEISSFFRVRLSEQMEKKGFTAYSLCKQLGDGWNPNNITDYQNGKAPKFSTAAAIARALGVTCDYLAGFSDNDGSTVDKATAADRLGLSAMSGESIDFLAALLSIVGNWRRNVLPSIRAAARWNISGTDEELYINSFAQQHGVEPDLPIRDYDLIKLKASDFISTLLSNEKCRAVIEGLIRDSMEYIELLEAHDYVLSLRKAEVEMLHSDATILRLLVNEYDTQYKGGERVRFDKEGHDIQLQQIARQRVIKKALIYEKTVKLLETLYESLKDSKGLRATHDSSAEKAVSDAKEWAEGAERRTKERIEKAQEDGRRPLTPDEEEYLAEFEDLCPDDLGYPEYEEEEKARELEERRYAEKLEEMRGGKIDG